MHKLLPLALLAFSLLGCATQARLVLRETTPVDRTAPADVRPTITSVMVLGAARSERDSGLPVIADIERALLRRGIRVVSSGITARAISGSNEARPTEAAGPLSDLERALIMARQTNVDALLQLTDLSWTIVTRKLVVDKELLREMDADSKRQPQVVADEAVFNLTARLIDVEDGNILLSLDLSQSSARAEAVDELLRIKGSSPVNIDLATPERRQLAVSLVMDALTDHFAQKSPGLAAVNVKQP